MSVLTDPEFSGRHLREVLRQRPDVCEAEHYQQGLVVVHDAGVQLAFDGNHPDVPAQLAAHARRMRQRIYRAGERVYCAVGYALANVIIVRCEQALVVLDTTESHQSAAQILQDFRAAVPEVADWPVAALVYTHNHSDHINGARAFVNEEDVQAGRTQIIAHATLMRSVSDNASVVAPILATRSAYSFGALLPPGPKGSVSAGIGPRIINSSVSFLPPTLTFDDELDITLAGVRFEFRHAPSETDDEIVVWLPDEDTLLSAEVIQGECLANVHTIRGTRYRDPLQWVDTIDVLRARHARQPVQWMVPAHGRPVGGQDSITELLTAYRDAIAFIHDQAVRFINHGATPDELADWLPALPPHLARHAWLGEYYGTVKHSVRQVFSGLLGWFDGDPATLDPLPPRARAQRWIALAGGREALLRDIEACEVRALAPETQRHDALDEYRWIAELAGQLLRVDPADAQALQAKARALRQLGLATLNTNWRHWYLSSALELEGRFAQVPFKGNGLAVRDIWMAIEPRQLLRNLGVRLQAERCLDLHMQLTLDFTDRRLCAVLELRRGVLQIALDAPATRSDMPSLRLLTTWPIWLRQMALGWPDLRQQLAQEEVVLTEGSPDQLLAFIDCFEKPAEHMPLLATR
jgi:alkyl sulfatase BDS1-like metallo-beta-lactamase superfamily hydrolase